MDRVFLQIIRHVNADQQVLTREEWGSETSKRNVWRYELLESILAVLQEFNDVFPQDLPLGRPLVRKWHEFKIELEDGQTLANRPLCKMSPLELEGARKQINSILEHGFIRPSDSPHGSPALFIPKKDGGLKFYIGYR